MLCCVLFFFCSPPLQFILHISCVFCFCLSHSCLDGSRPPSQPCQRTSCFDGADVFISFSWVFLCGSVSPPSLLLKDGSGGNPGVEAALMFNLSLFVLVYGYPGPPPGVCVSPASCLSSCWLKALQEYDTGGIQGWRWGCLFSQLPPQWCKQPISWDARVMSLFNNSNLMHLFILYKGI